jgi:hypothetical protein
VILIFRCLNGVVLWVARQESVREGRLRCVRDNFSIPMSYVADHSWEVALAGAMQHSVTLAGAFQDLYVLPSQF